MMQTSPSALSESERAQVLRFAASFLWADLKLLDVEREFFLDLARELGVGKAGWELAANLLERPPTADEVDPSKVDPALADKVRDVALRAIAADGRVLPEEMSMFDLLDALLPNDSAR